MGGMNALGGFMGSRESNQMNEKAARDQRNWQESMSNSAHQREVQDLMAAGLNPILSAGGGGASTPGGGMQAPAESPIANMTAGISKGADTAIALRSQNKALDMQDSQIENTNEDTSNKIASQALIQNQAGSSAKDIEAKSMSNKILKETLDSQIKKAKAEGDYSELNQIMGLVNAGTSSAASLVNPFKQLKNAAGDLLKPTPKVKTPYGH